jgi:hypothetical protein
VAPQRAGLGRLGVFQRWQRAQIEPTTRAFSIRKMPLVKTAPQLSQRRSINGAGSPRASGP